MITYQKASFCYGSPSREARATENKGRPGLMFLRKCLVFLADTDRLVRVGGIAQTPFPRES